jgi:hypothetical protein
MADQPEQLSGDYRPEFAPAMHEAACRSVIERSTRLRFFDTQQLGQVHLI